MAAAALMTVAWLVVQMCISEAVSLTFLPERPHMVYLRLEHNRLYLGDIIIVLNGPNPKLVQQFLELATGNNSVGGTWRGSGFSGGVHYLGQPGESIHCSGYTNASGLQTGSLFPVENTIPFIAGVAGEVHGHYPRGGQDRAAGFYIRTKSNPDWYEKTPLIGQVTSESLGILQAVAARGYDFVKEIEFTDCGLVVFTKYT